jgi:hypothetical protein
MNMQALSAHVLAALALAQTEGRRLDLESLTALLRVRRGDVRRAVSALHREGFVDALRMRPTMLGFVLGRSYARSPLPELRPVAEAPPAAVAAA